MDLGENYPCLNVEDLPKSIEFYEKLGFKMILDKTDEDWAWLQHNNMVVCLYCGQIGKNLINFRGGDVKAIYEEAIERGLEFTGEAEEHSEGGWSATLVDPDGNCIFFNTFPDEREKYGKKGKLIDY